mmetsp:Transcript_22921/g.56483  ORF Transcript_22921/g.56483 Transcript_22921/m.56483 type:complete len:399 (-) Transcript_22921:241-1437(-)
MYNKGLSFVVSLTSTDTIHVGGKSLTGSRFVSDNGPRIRVTSVVVAHLGIAGFTAGASMHMGSASVRGSTVRTGGRRIKGRETGFQIHGISHVTDSIGIAHLDGGNTSSGIIGTTERFQISFKGTHHLGQDTASDTRTVFGVNHKGSAFHVHSSHFERGSKLGAAIGIRRILSSDPRVDHDRIRKVVSTLGSRVFTSHTRVNVDTTSIGGSTARCLESGLESSDVSTISNSGSIGSVGKYYNGSTDWTVNSWNGGNGGVVCFITRNNNRLVRLVRLNVGTTRSQQTTGHTATIVSMNNKGLHFVKRLASTDTIHKGCRTIGTGGFISDNGPWIRVASVVVAHLGFAGFAAGSSMNVGSTSIRGSTVGTCCGRRVKGREVGLKTAAVSHVANHVSTGNR